MIELKGRRCLFISYNGMLDPLGQSQVIPYLKELAGQGVSFILISFEQPAKLQSESAQLERLSKELSANNIEWHWLRYHSWPSLPATIYDVICGILIARKLIKKNPVDIVHARSHIPATIAVSLKKTFKMKMIFDVRGLMADEYVDAEHWRKNSLPYRLTKTAERKAFAASNGVVTLTEKIWPLLKTWPGLRNREVVHEVIPCCADLELYNFNARSREQRREELGLNSRFVIVYSGSIDGWYLTAEMADLFAEALQQRPDAFFLWLTQRKHDRIRSLMKERNIDERSYAVLSSRPHDVPSYLSAADAGIAFIKPCLSKQASSPTKYAEYLGCGLPLIINKGIGDADALICDHKIGSLVNEFTPMEYRRAFREVEVLSQNKDEIRRATRDVAEKLFDVRVTGATRYADLYRRVLNSSS